MKKSKVLKTVLFIIISAMLFFIDCNDSNPTQSDNTPPKCKITSPSENSIIIQDEIVTIAVEAKDENGNINEVRFFIDENEESAVTSSPYNYKWNTENVDTGHHVIKAIAKDNDNDISCDEINIFIIKSNFSTVTDIDGNVYKTVKIGDQWWMAENLKVTHYRNGDKIPNVINRSEWEELYPEYDKPDKQLDAFCYYDNDIGNSETHGNLYNWFALKDSRNIAPEGWHIPTDEEWKQLETHIGMSQSEVDTTYWRGNDEGKKLKSISSWHNNGNGTDDFGFSALPAGYRTKGGYFESLGYSTKFWSISAGWGDYCWYRGVSDDQSGIFRFNSTKRRGNSVRCLRD